MIEGGVYIGVNIDVYSTHVRVSLKFFIIITHLGNYCNHKAWLMPMDKVGSQLSDVLFNKSLTSGATLVFVCVFIGSKNIYIWNNYDIGYNLKNKQGIISDHKNSLNLGSQTYSISVRAPCWVCTCWISHVWFSAICHILHILTTSTPDTAVKALERTKCIGLNLFKEWP